MKITVFSTQSYDHLLTLSNMPISGLRDFLPVKRSLALHKPRYKMSACLKKQANVKIKSPWNY
jgi:hypothetical protein